MNNFNRMFAKQRFRQAKQLGALRERLETGSLLDAACEERKKNNSQMAHFGWGWVGELEPWVFNRKVAEM